MISVSKPTILGCRPAFGRLRGLCRALLLLLLLFLAPAAASAQDYYVKSVTGSVRLVRGKKSAPVQRRFKLSPEDVLRIGQNSQVELLKMGEKKHFTLTTPCQKTLSQFLKDKRTRVKECSKAFWRYLLQELGGDDEIVADTKGINTTVVYRDADSLMLERAIVPADSMFTEDAE